VLPARDIVEKADYDGEIWFIDDGNDYPRLGWQYPEPPPLDPGSGDVDTPDFDTPAIEQLMLPAITATPIGGSNKIIYRTSMKNCRLFLV
jgi:hypothetical protein